MRTARISLKVRPPSLSVQQTNLNMHPIEETRASYHTSSLKTPTLLSKPLRTTSSLNGRAYVAVGQVEGVLHKMAMSPVEVADLHRTTDLALRSTKQIATAIGHSIVMVAMERHL